ncbi:MAG: hypothetical protein ACREDY_11525, partial [Bradyrhizobium sp.]
MIVLHGHTVRQRVDDIPEQIAIVFGALPVLPQLLDQKVQALNLGLEPIAAARRQRRQGYHCALPGDGDLAGVEGLLVGRPQQQQRGAALANA